MEHTTDVIDNGSLTHGLLVLGGRVALVVANLGPTDILTSDSLVRLSSVKVRREGEKRGSDIEAIQSANRGNSCWQVVLLGMLERQDSRQGRQ